VRLPVEILKRCCLPAGPPESPRAARYHDGSSGRRGLNKYQSKTGAELPNALLVGNQRDMHHFLVQASYMLRSDRADT
jgi:hypothetical protein